MGVYKRKKACKEGGFPGLALTRTWALGFTTAWDGVGWQARPSTQLQLLSTESWLSPWILIKATQGHVIAGLPKENSMYLQ